MRKWLRRFPVIHASASAAYYACRELLERAFGGPIQRAMWSAESRIDGGVTDAEFAEACAHPHRALVLDAIERLGPLETILEFGCGSGANLVRIAERFRGIRLSALDVNARSVEFAVARLLHMHPDLPVDEIRAGGVEALAALSAGSVDVVLADAVLMYVPVGDIESTLRELVRVAKVAVVLSDWQVESGWPAVQSESPMRSAYHFGHWIHDYAGRLRLMPGIGSIAMERYPVGAWEDANWKRWGAVIVAVKSER